MIPWLMLLLVGCPSDTTPNDDDTAGPDIDDDDAVDDDDSATGPTLDEQLAELLAAQDVPIVALEPVSHDPALVDLGKALFFDPILSGNKDVACASCHHPSWGTSDGLSLTLGVGATGVGPERAEGDHPPFSPRHAIDLFNRGDASINALFWDGRVEGTPAGLSTPAGIDPLPGLAGPLAAQALFPLLDPGEMRGQPGDDTILGAPNELAGLTDSSEVWEALLARLLDIPAYVDLFEAAYPAMPSTDWTFAQAVNAIAAFEATAFSFTDSPWDQYLRGDLTALRDVDKLGASLFYGVAGCSECHSGALLSDGQFHVTAVPQLGPGLPDDAPFDTGRRRVTGDDADRFAFRTPPLRNLALTAPYMHDGALMTLEDVVLHYAAPLSTAEDYDPSVLHSELENTVQQDPAHLAELTANVSPLLPTEGGPLRIGLSNLREFLTVGLMDPAANDLPDIRPATVPSGLDVP